MSALKVVSNVLVRGGRTLSLQDFPSRIAFRQRISSHVLRARFPELLSMPVFVFVLFLLSLPACNETGVDPLHEADQSGASHTVAPLAVPAELLVKFKPDVAPERITAILKDARTELIAVLQGTRIYHLRVTGQQSVESVVKQLSSLPEVEYAEPNYAYHLQKQ
jgi:hypothetical protein